MNSPAVTIDAKVDRTIRLTYFVAALVVIAMLGGIAYAFAATVSDLRADQKAQTVKYEQLRVEFETFRRDVAAFQGEARQTLSNLSTSFALVQGLITATVPKQEKKR